MLERTKEEVFNLLREHLEGHLLQMSVNYAGSDRLVDVFEDIRWLGSQKNMFALMDLMNIQNLYAFLSSNEDKLDTRWHFIVKATMLLKLQLGESWNDLIFDLKKALFVFGDKKIEHHLLKGVNQHVVYPDTSRLDDNHWLVPILLYGIMPDTTSIIDNFLLDLQEVKEPPQPEPKSRNKVNRL